MQHAGGRGGVEDLRRYNDKLLRLCRLTADIARLGDEHRTLQIIVDTAADLIGVAAAHLALVDKDEEQLYGVVSSGRHPDDAPRLRLQLSQSGAAQEALRARAMITIEDADDDARVNPRARDLMGIRGVAYIPLLSGEQSFGLLILVTRKAHRWTGEQKSLAECFADVAAVAMENSRLMAQLAETEARLRSLIEHIPAIVYVCDVTPPYKTLYISPQAREMLGFAPEEWTTDRKSLFTKIVHPDDLQSIIDNEDATRAKGFGANEYRLLDSQGRTRWFRDEAVLVRDPAGRPIAWHGVMVEITGIKTLKSQH